MPQLFYSKITQNPGLSSPFNAWLIPEVIALLMLRPPLGSCFKDPKPSLRFGAFFCLSDSRISETELGILHACHLSSFTGRKRRPPPPIPKRFVFQLGDRGTASAANRCLSDRRQFGKKREEKERNADMQNIQSIYPKKMAGGCLYYNWGKAVFLRSHKGKTGFYSGKQQLRLTTLIFIAYEKKVEKRDPDKKGYYYFYLHLTIPRKIGECVTKAFVEIKLLFLGKRQRDRLRALLAPRNFPFSRRDK